ncbi:MAG: hypothetical protein WAZ21_04320 [Candidatus Saccharimonadales bacterium]
MLDGKGMNTSPHFVLTPEMRALFEEFDSSNLMEVNLRDVPTGTKVSILTASWSVYEVTNYGFLFFVNPMFSRVLDESTTFELYDEHEYKIVLGSPWDVPDIMVTNRVTGILVH